MKTYRIRYHHELLRRLLCNMGIDCRIDIDPTFPSNGFCGCVIVMPNERLTQEEIDSFIDNTDGMDIDTEVPKEIEEKIRAGIIRGFVESVKLMRPIDQSDGTGSFTWKKALTLAYYSHYGQTDKSGYDYILHPIRVGFSADSERGRMLGLLHDIVEDTDVTFEKLREVGCSEDIISGIDCLTRREGESYDAFIERCIGSKDIEVIRTKVRDIDDNVSRLEFLQSEKEREFLRNKYNKARAILKKALRGLHRVV